MPRKSRPAASERSNPAVSRRGFIGAAGVGAFGLSLSPALNPLPLIAAPTPTPAAPPPPREALNRFPRMMQGYFVHRVRDIEAAGNRARAALRTKAHAEQYVADVRQKIAACFGPLPEKTSLNPRVTGLLERDAYRVEKVIFESRPGFLVTANLYAPRGASSPSLASSARAAIPTMAKRTRSTSPSPRASRGWATSC